MREGAAGKASRTGVGVEAVAPGSPADRAGIVPGDRILSVSGRPVADLLDLHFLTSRSRFTLAWRDASGAGRRKEFRLEGETPGIFPEPIRVRRCRNRCIFCFVHQLPKGLRRTLYVKDEDVRLSFLHGQYVTFSDLSDEEAAKIVRYRLSPLYVSIHTTDPELRRRMLGNPGAADVMRVMRRLIRAGIVLHGQIVVCPGVNDGAELARTLRELSGLRPGLRTVAVVPVGLTSHRAGLPPLRPVTRRRGAGDARPAPRAGQGVREKRGRGAVRGRRRRILPDGGTGRSRPPVVRIVRADRKRRGAGPAVPGRGGLPVPEETVAGGRCRGDRRNGSFRIAPCRRIP